MSDLDLDEIYNFTIKLARDVSTSSVPPLTSTHVLSVHVRFIVKANFDTGIKDGCEGELICRREI
jgi:hypothetical protein